MRRSWKSLIAAPVLVYSLGCTDSVGLGLDPTLDELVLAFCSNELPVWFAYQNQGDEWKRVQPDANNAFVFDASDHVAIALTFDDGSNRLTEVYQVHVNELLPLSGKACNETSGTKTVNGSVAGVGLSETARISMSEQFTTATALDDDWTLTNVANAAQDLVAVRGIGSDDVPNRVIIRRAQNPVSGGTLSVLDFGSTDAFAIATNTLLVSGITSGESNYYFVDFSTATGTSHPLYTSDFFTSPSQTLYGIPSTLTQAGDLHKIDLNADAQSLTSYRTVWKFFRNPVDQTLSFGGPLNTPTVQNLTSTPYSRLRANLPSQSEYSDFATAYFIQSSRSVYVTVTAGFADGTPGSWVLEIPDFTAAGGYPTNAGLQSGLSTQWFVEAFSGSLENYISATPADGATIKFAGRMSDTQTSQRSVVGGRPSPRALLERRAFRQ